MSAGTVSASERLGAYYRDPWVRHRIREYCGEADGEATCVYLSTVNGHQNLFERSRRIPAHALETLLGEGVDVARSMWDRANLLIHLDLDYQHLDSGDEPYERPVEMFAKLEPVYRATVAVLQRFGMPLLPLITGRGYHFTGRVPLEADVTTRLASHACETPAWLATLPQRCAPWMAADMSVRHARAYAGAGLIAELLAQLIVKRASRRARIPVVLNGTVVGSGVVGRECISIDVSYAGDPLDVRHVRTAFASYQKHAYMGAAAAHRLGPIAAVPRLRESLPDLLSQQRVLTYAARAARQRTAAIPLVSDGVARVLDVYESSTLARFHRAFYSMPGGSPGLFDDLVASRHWRSLPECVTGPLLEPNDRLLQPAVIQHVTRALLAERFTAREIAEIIRSRYAADFNWGRRWRWHDARTRAEFDVRVFAGLLATGLDRCVDFNCRSAQEKRICPGTPCTWDLRTNRVHLLERIGA